MKIIVIYMQSVVILSYQYLHTSYMIISLPTLISNCVCVNLLFILTIKTMVDSACLVLVCYVTTCQNSFFVNLLKLIKQRNRGTKVWLGSSKIEFSCIVYKDGLNQQSSFPVPISN